MRKPRAYQQRKDREVGGGNGLEGGAAVVAEVEEPQLEEESGRGWEVDCRGHVIVPSASSSSAQESTIQILKAKEFVIKGWLTIKEISLLLGTMVEHLPIDSSSTHIVSATQTESSPAPFDGEQLFILSADTIDDIAQILLGNILSTKHNGAIEKVSSSFFQGA